MWANKMCIKPKILIINNQCVPLKLTHEAHKELLSITQKHHWVKPFINHQPHNQLILYGKGFFLPFSQYTSCSKSKV